MKFYRQTTEYTSAASSLLMVLHHLKDVALSAEEEFSIWHASANLPVRASSVYGLALVAAKHGLSPRLVLEEREYDYPDYLADRYSKKEVDAAKFSSRLYAKRAQEAGIPLDQREVTIDTVLRELGKGRIVLLRLNVGPLRKGEDHSRYVVTYQVEGEDLFTIMDSLFGPSEVDADVLEACMASLHARKGRDVRMIVFD